MRTVHKYALGDVDNEVETHRGAKFVHVDNQREQICVWAEVDTHRPKCKRRVEVVGTGQRVPLFADYVGSCLMMQGTFVFHVYIWPERADA